MTVFDHHLSGDNSVAKNFGCCHRHRCAGLACSNHHNPAKRIIYPGYELGISLEIVFDGQRWIYRFKRGPYNLPGQLTST